MLTPRDIETKEFSHGKGYKAEEVEAFLDEILVDYTALIEERDNLSRRVLALSEKLENFRDEQEEWKQTLLHTQKSYDEVMQLAKENSAKMIAEAEKEAAKIKEDAVKAANEATAEADKQRAEKNALSDEIANFKSKMLSIYEEHIKNLNNLPQIAKESLAGVRVAEPQPSVSKEPESVSFEEAPAEETKVIPTVTKIADVSKAATRAKINKALDIIGDDYDDEDDDDFLIKESTRRRVQNEKNAEEARDVRENKIRDLFGDGDAKSRRKNHTKPRKASRFFIDDDDDDDDFYDEDDE